MPSHILKDSLNKKLPWVKRNLWYDFHTFNECKGNFFNCYISINEISFILHYPSINNAVKIRCLHSCFIFFLKERACQKECKSTEKEFKCENKKNGNCVQVVSRTPLSIFQLEKTTQMFSIGLWLFLLPHMLRSQVKMETSVQTDISYSF